MLSHGVNRPVPRQPPLLPVPPLLAGTALAFATLFKLGQRSALLGPAARVFPHAVHLLGSQLAASNALARCVWDAGGRTLRSQRAGPCMLQGLPGS